MDDELKDKIKYLPQQYRDTAYFITMARIKQFVTTVLVATESDQIQIKKWNIISIYNFNLDIIRLETYSRQTLVPGLCEMFVGLKQLLDLLLSGKRITEYLNEVIILCISSQFIIFESSIGLIHLKSAIIIHSGHQNGKVSDGGNPECSVFAGKV